MPRNNYPRIRAKHPRAKARYNDKRVAKKRFDRAKRTYADAYHTTQSRDYEVVGRYLRSKNRIAPFFVHPNDILKDPSAFYMKWPFGYSLNEWSDNPMTHCSCEGCSGYRYSSAQRSREKRQWEKDYFEEMDNN